MKLQDIKKLHKEISEIDIIGISDLATIAIYENKVITELLKYLEEKEKS